MVSIKMALYIKKSLLVFSLFVWERCGGSPYHNIY